MVVFVFSLFKNLCLFYKQKRQKKAKQTPKIQTEQIETKKSTEW